MAMIYCPECGKEISDKAYFCPNCGYVFKENAVNINFSVKKKIPGRGFGIAGMVMGILGVVYSLTLLLSFISFGEAVAMGVYLTTFAILALIFGFTSRAKGYKSGQSASALVMGCITIAFYIITILKSILFYLKA